MRFVKAFGCRFDGYGYRPGMGDELLFDAHSVVSMQRRVYKDEKTKESHKYYVVQCRKKNWFYVSEKDGMRIFDELLIEGNKS